MTEALELSQMSDEQLANAARGICKELDKFLSELGRREYRTEGQTVTIEYHLWNLTPDQRYPVTTLVPTTTMKITKEIQL